MRRTIRLALTATAVLLCGRGTFAQQHHQDSGRYTPRGADHHTRRYSDRHSDPHAVRPYRRPTYVFGARQYTNELALQLKNQANAVCWEIHSRYHDHPRYGEIYGEMYKILQDAKHVHELAHSADVHSGAVDHIANDLHNIDKLFHHVQEAARPWMAGSAHHGSGLAAKMGYFEETLHHMMKDYGVKSRIVPNDGRPMPVQR